MTITIHTTGHYKEVGFHDVERDDVRAYSGLLTEEDAHDFAERLQEVARQLTQERDESNQTLLSFVRAA